MQYSSPPFAFLLVLAKTNEYLFARTWGIIVDPLEKVTLKRRVYEIIEKWTPLHKKGEVLHDMVFAISITGAYQSRKWAKNGLTICCSTGCGIFDYEASFLGEVFHDMVFVISITGAYQRLKRAKNGLTICCSTGCCIFDYEASFFLNGTCSSILELLNLSFQTAINIFNIFHKHEQ